MEYYSNITIIIKNNIVNIIINNNIVNINI